MTEAVEVCMRETLMVPGAKSALRNVFRTGGGSGIAVAVCLCALIAISVPALAAGEIRPEPDGMQDRMPDGMDEDGMDKEETDETPPRIQFTRRVRLVAVAGVQGVILEPVREDDVLGEIGVDAATELGRALLEVCPDGSLCAVDAALEDGTFIHIYTLRRVRQ
jgi:hypothetical protein